VLINNRAEDSTTYVTNNSDSIWVWQQFTGDPGGVVRTFRLTFDLTGLNPSTADISGRWTSDNNGLDILVNGNSTGQTSDVDAFHRWYDFTIPSQYLLGGPNTIDFKVNEAGYPGGFRAEFFHSTADPATTGVPDAGSTFGLIGLALAGLAWVRRTGRAA